MAELPKSACGLQYETWIPQATIDYLNYSRVLDGKTRYHWEPYPDDLIHLKQSLNVRKKAAELLLTNALFKPLWQQVALNNCVNFFSMFDSIFISFYYQQEHKTYYKTKKDLDYCVYAIKRIMRLYEENYVLQLEVDCAYEDALSKVTAPAVLDSYYMFPIFTDSFLQRLNKGWLHAHYTYFPTRSCDAEYRERYFFTTKLTELVWLITGRVQHQIVADILNLIRPDLGEFNVEAVRKTIARWPKRTVLKKKPQHLSQSQQR